ncbi:YlbF family regulator [Levilactobacillus yonginensis]|uniref:YlbF family regulator n=1 Tax=Levilactobacillus yonginensis TaxID=1054041 RepID=UPI000F787CBB|nr:YlbF family regulator [Levilactobacillus yonginensis]
MADKMEDLGAQLAQALQESEEFTGLETAYNDMKADADTYQLFKDFQKIQMDLQQKQMAGQELTNDEMSHAREVADKVSKIASIKTLMEKERDVNTLLSNLNQTITKPIESIYQG